jgi:hypothetical protein
MELKFISNEAYTQLMKRLDGIEKYLNKQAKKKPLDEIWLDIREVCALLKISTRTLQHYRDERKLPYSQISGKIYFKASDIQKHLEKNYHK